MTRKLAGLLLVALVVGGCASSRAFRRGEEAMRAADPDSAVVHFTEAVQADPDNPDYKIQLRRAQEEAARLHIEKAKQLEAQDQLDAALAEYRKSLEMVGTDRLAQAKVTELERTIRERLEATRPKPKIDQLGQQARGLNAPPLLNPASREPIRFNFHNAALRDILNFIGTSAGINITFDQQFVDKPYTVNLDGVTVEEALSQVLSANGYYFKVIGPRTVLIIPDQPAKHQQYDDLVIKVFFISHADATELPQLVNTIMRIPRIAVHPMVMPSKTANTITVRATAPVVDVMERLIRANDKPRAEVLLDVEILEVDRTRVKRYGLNLSAYALGLMFSPEVAPPNTSASPGAFLPSPPPFNLNTISQGISTADFYLAVPTALVNFLEQDNRTRILAKPQLRGQEGQKLTLNLGADVPVVQTVFGAAAAGGFATIPQSSFNYRPTGVNLDITPRVTYEGEIILDLSVENSAIGASIDVGGQQAPSFTSRKVHTFLRLREGEPNLLAGLIRQDNTDNRSGPIGLMRLPVFKQLFSDNSVNHQDTDIVMLVTPHIIRDHDLTKEDVGSMYIGTQANVGLTGPPPLIAPTGGEQPPAAGAAPVGVPGINPIPPGGVPGPPTASPGGVPQINPPAPAGTQPAPGVTPQTQPLQPAPGVVPPVAQPGTPPAGTTPPATTPPTTVPPTTPPATPPAQPTTPPAAATAAQIIVTPPGTEFRVAGGPYTVPVSINNASRVSVLTLAITYNPAVLRVRTVQDGLFMRQGGNAASFTPRIDAGTGRVEIAFARTADQTGASGAGLLAALLFDAIAPGSTSITVSGVASAPGGAPIPLNFAPVSVTVR